MSMATVSRVVKITTLMLKKIQDYVFKEVIKKLKYTPNAVARGLASKKQPLGIVYQILLIYLL